MNLERSITLFPVVTGPYKTLIMKQVNFDLFGDFGSQMLKPLESVLLSDEKKN